MINMTNIGDIRLGTSPKIKLGTWLVFKIVLVDLVILLFLKKDLVRPIYCCKL